MFVIVNIVCYKLKYIKKNIQKLGKLLYNSNTMTIDDQKRIGEKIRQARVLASISQNQLAELVGFGRNSMIETEKGRRAVNTTELQKIAQVTNKPLSFFLEDESIRAFNHAKIRDLRDIKDEDLAIIDSVIETIRKKYTDR